MSATASSVDAETLSLAALRDRLTDAEIYAASEQQIRDALTAIRDDFYRGLSPTGKDVVRKMERTNVVDLDEAREMVLIPHRDYWMRRKREAQAADAEFETSMQRLYGGLSLPALESRLNSLQVEIDRMRCAGRREFDGNGRRRTSAATSNEAARELGKTATDLKRYIQQRRQEGL